MSRKPARKKRRHQKHFLSVFTVRHEGAHFSTRVEGKQNQLLLLFSSVTIFLLFTFFSSVDILVRRLRSLSPNPILVLYYSSCWLKFFFLSFSLFVEALLHLLFPSWWRSSYVWPLSVLQHVPAFPSGTARLLPLLPGSLSPLPRPKLSPAEAVLWAGPLDGRRSRSPPLLPAAGGHRFLRLLHRRLLRHQLPDDAQLLPRQPRRDARHPVSHLHPKGVPIRGERPAAALAVITRARPCTHFPLTILSVSDASAPVVLRLY